MFVGLFAQCSGYFGISVEANWPLEKLENKEPMAIQETIIMRLPILKTPPNKSGPKIPKTM